MSSIEFVVGCEDRCISPFLGRPDYMRDEIVIGLTCLSVGLLGGRRQYMSWFTWRQNLVQDACPSVEAEPGK